jgi:hypothetical protein
MSSGMCRRVVLVGTDVHFYPEEDDDAFLKHVGSYKSHTA